MDTCDLDLSLAYAPVIEDIRPFLGILVGIVGSIVLVALIIVIIVRMRGSTGRDRNNYTHGHTTTTTTTTTATSQGHRHNNTGLNGLHNGSDIHVGRGNCHVTSSLDSIDKNPDIIPHGKYQCERKITVTRKIMSVVTASHTYDEKTI